MEKNKGFIYTNIWLIMGPYFIGVDIGTQGARVVLLDAEGEVAASAGQVFPLNEASREEQSPEGWWRAFVVSLKELKDKAAGLDFNEVKAMAVTSTSGTVIPLDAAHQPLHNAIMYSDKRSAKQAAICTATAVKYHNKGFTAFNTSSALAKMVWFGDAYPEKAVKISKWIHAADYITGKLSGRWGVTDYTNAFKTGYDVSSYEWPEYLYTHLPLKKAWLPEVFPSGTVIGTLDEEVAAVLGLPASIQVTVGITDGCASQIASGAVKPGEWNTTIGTTMVIKGVTKKQIVDEEGRIYSHRHPAGYWMPGGASNTGADWVTNEFGDNLDALSKAAEKLVPTDLISYPLRQHGERFPMVAPDAVGFEQEGLSMAERFTANMEGVAYLERFSFELIQGFTKEKINAVFTAGGGSNSDVWLKIRSNVLNLPIYKMKEVSGAVGAAILAASNTHFSSLADAVAALTTIEKEVHPEPELVAVYEKNYHRFLNLLLEKGYIKKGEIHA
ncbi:FGGY-family carbohydrate kinase [Pedobacter africanus]|uniref:Sugar (Pentulose or hexulose) kinase n=1 Tax=Pedobacter africanus TaxID=151894 RepID=A0A1W2A7Z1_9SPHI|nr:FGGY-family carbohydrate kinase [Pedobacter africanus]SMC56859.1 Sugar (pentulose or hexulose) kinase [Pedobacter africanus]